MKRAYIVAAVFGVIVVGIDAWILLSAMPTGLKIYLPQIFINVLLHIAATVIFILGLKGFRQRLKVTYLFICASMLMLVFGLIQGVVLASLNASGSAYAVLGGAGAPYLVMNVLAFLGVRLLANQIQVKSTLLNPGFTFGLAAIVGLLAVLLPTTRTDVAAYTIHIAAGLSAAVVIIVIITTGLLLKAMSQVSLLYKSALRWLALYYATIAIAITANLLAQQYVSPVESFQIYLFGYAIFVVAAILALVAALSFSRVAYAEDEVIKSASQKANNSVDIIVCLALLVSNPKSVDPILDDLRTLTSSLDTRVGSESSQLLSEDQQTTTARIYLQIEEFLVNQEPVRKFTSEQLRQMINIKFKDSVQEPVFWQKLLPAVDKEVSA